MGNDPQFIYKILHKREYQISLCNAQTIKFQNCSFPLNNTYDSLTVGVNCGYIDVDVQIVNFGFINDDATPHVVNCGYINGDATLHIVTLGTLMAMPLYT